MRRFLAILLLVFGLCGPAWGTSIYVKKIGSTVYYDATAACCDDVTAADLTAGYLSSVSTAAGAGGICYVCEGNYTELGGTGSFILQAANQKWLGVGNVVLDANGGSVPAFTSGASGGGFVLHNFEITNASGANGRGAVAQTSGSILNCRFRNNTQHTRAGGTGTTASIRGCDFQGAAGDADVYLITGTGTVDVSLNTFRPYGTAAAGCVMYQGTGTYDIHNNIFGGSENTSILPYGTPAGGTVRAYNNIFIPGATAAGKALSCSEASVCTAKNNWMCPSAFTPDVMLSNVDADEGNSYLSSPGMADTGRNGYLCITQDDYNVGNDSWGYLYGADGTDGLLALCNSKGVGLTWYINTASMKSQPNYAERVAWAKANGAEIGFHTRTHSDLTFSGTVFTTSGNVTINRIADTITTAGGTITGFRAMTIGEIKTTLEASPHDLTVTPYGAGYNSTTVDDINAGVLGEALDDCTDSTTISILVGDHTQGYLYSELSAIDDLEAVVGAGTVTSLAYPFGANNVTVQAAVRDFRSGQITSARTVNIDTGSSQSITDLNRYAIGCFNSVDVKTDTTSGGTTDDIKANINGLCAYLAVTGGFAEILSHSASELTLSQMETVIDTVVTWSGTVNASMSVGQAMAEIIAFATDDGDGTLSYTWPSDASFNGCAIRSDSELINAGTTAQAAGLVGNQTDGLGNTYFFPPAYNLNIGADQTPCNWPPRIMGGSFGGQ